MQIFYNDIQAKTKVRPEKREYYYPFGLTLTSTAAGSTEQPHKYQTKELERSFGLETYDFHARYYDPQLGRFNNIDPLAYKFYHMSPYAGMGNNPVMFVDPDGREINLSNLSPKQLEVYNNNISMLNESSIFKAYYEHLVNSKEVYTIFPTGIYEGDGEDYMGFYIDNKVGIGNELSLDNISEELFHAYQDDLRVYNNQDNSVTETEADLVRQYVLLDIGVGTLGAEWADNMSQYGYPPSLDDVKSKSYQDDFTKTVNKRIESKLLDPKSPKSYIQPNSGKGSLALIRVLETINKDK